MDKLYYMISNGQQVGPFSAPQLLANGLTPATMVWTEGMADWMPAGNIPALSELMLHNEQAAPSQNDPFTASQPNPYPGNPAMNRPDDNVRPYVNWMPWAITGTILGFLFSCIGAIFGIIGIVNANKANTAYNYGDYQKGESANSTAKIMSIIALALGGLGIVCSILVMIGVISSPLATLK